MNNIDKLNSLKNRASELLKYKGYTVINNNEEISLLDIHNNTIANISLFKDNIEVLKHAMIYHTRSCNPEDKDTCTVSSLWVDRNNRGKGLATLLLIYAISVFFIHHPTIQYVTLDDNSYRSHKLRNIYTQLGFTTSGYTKLTSHNTIALSGPEKEVTLLEFIERASRYLAFQGGGIKTKKRRYKRRKKSRRHRCRKRRKRQTQKN